MANFDRIICPQCNGGKSMLRCACCIGKGEVLKFRKETAPRPDAPPSPATPAERRRHRHPAAPRLVALPDLPIWEVDECAETLEGVLIRVRDRIMAERQEGKRG